MRHAQGSNLVDFALAEAVCSIKSNGSVTRSVLSSPGSLVKSTLDLQTKTRFFLMARMSGQGQMNVLCDSLRGSWQREDEVDEIVGFSTQLSRVCLVS